MTPTEQIIALSGFNDTAKIDILVNITKKEIETYTKRIYDTLTMDSLLVEMVIYKVQKLGNEATKSLIYNDTTQSFLTDYPTPILRQLNELKKRVRLL